MTRTYLDYAKLLLSLMPRGKAWRKIDAVRDEFFNGKGVELARIESRMNDLITESRVATTTELIAEHEYDLGLPDGILTTSDKTTAERRNQLSLKILALGSLHKQYYINLAAKLGYTIHIDEFTPAWSGVACAGDPCGDQHVIFYWMVNVHYDFIDPFTDYADLEYIIKKLRPIHTIALFRTYGPGFSNGFSQGFNARSTAQLTGGFTKGFTQGFDVMNGGGFAYAAFSSGFSQIK